MSDEDWFEEIADLDASELLEDYSIEDLEAGRAPLVAPELIQRAKTRAAALQIEDMGLMVTEVFSRIQNGWEKLGVPPCEYRGRGIDPPALGLVGH
jgi:hypothetical protein